MSDLKQNIGNTLRKSREKQGISLEDLASQIKVNSKYLEDIENNIFLDKELLAYTKGHIKLYCQAISINSDKILQTFDESFQTYYDKKSCITINKHNNKSSNSLDPAKKLGTIKRYIIENIMKFKKPADNHSKDTENVNNIIESENKK
ncbi:MAG: helix-turn-helix domain-containing protein [Pseudomonadota bacterium]|nr:helix-turn-helix domain-containing protein [Pseudomonadota bacterium]